MRKRQGTFVAVLLVALAVLAAVVRVDADEQCGCAASPLNFGGPMEDCCCEYADVDTINRELKPVLEALVDTDFFRYFRVNLRRDCPFWHEEGQCSTEHCSVEEAADIPEAIREWEERLARVDYSHQGFPIVKSCATGEKDFCMVEGSDIDCTYINLLLNPETFTGFSGPSAHRIWRAIYEENCFGTDLDDGQNQCLEARTFFRVLSGMHASIAAHMAGRYHDRQRDTFFFHRNEFRDRLEAYPDRIKNLYFAYAIVLRAVAKLGDYLANYEIATGNMTEDARVLATLKSLVTVTRQCPTTFDENTLFRDPSAATLRRQFKEHFRNISRITDCIGCEKCRLWSKVQINGYGTAFKVLFSYNEHIQHGEVDYELSRNELVAMMHTLRLLAESVEFVQEFRRTYRPPLSLPLPQSKSTVVLSCAAVAVATAAMWAWLRTRRRSRTAQSKQTAPPSDAKHSVGSATARH